MLTRCGRLLGSFPTRRVSIPFKAELDRMAWRRMRSEMVDFFKSRPARDSAVSLSAHPWPRYTPKERIIEEGFIPAVIAEHGHDRQVILPKAALYSAAFDDGPHSHVSHLFTGRLFSLLVDGVLEQCVVAEYKAHPVERELYFVRFARHVPGTSREVPVPISLTGLFGCPGVLAGGQVDLVLPTVKVVCPGPLVPPPLLVDCSSLGLGRLTLADLKPLLPREFRFSPSYRRLNKAEVVLCYDHRQVEETPLTADYQDPNFFRPSGKKYHLTYSGFWPKQH